MKHNKRLVCYVWSGRGDAKAGAEWHCETLQTRTENCFGVSPVVRSVCIYSERHLIQQCQKKTQLAVPSREGAHFSDRFPTTAILPHHGDLSIGNTSPYRRCYSSIDSMIYELFIRQQQSMVTILWFCVCVCARLAVFRRT